MEKACHPLHEMVPSGTDTFEACHSRRKLLLESTDLRGKRLDVDGRCGG